MVIVGEKLNSSIPKALDIFTRKDEAALLALAKDQIDHGAEYLDLNCAMMPDEKASLLWAANTLTRELDCPIMLDSPDSEAISFVYEAVPIRKSIINSVSLDPERFDGGVAAAIEYGAGVVAMPIGDKGMPKSARDRVDASHEIIARITDKGISLDRIYVDLVAEAAGADAEAPLRSIEAAKVLRGQYPGIHLICGLSNVSFGLPRRPILNSAFLCCLMEAGMDSVIIDPLQTETMLTLRACELMLGHDEYCMEYIGACRDAEEEEDG